MNSRKYTNSKKSDAEIERSKPKRKNKKLKKIKKIIQVCPNPNFGEGFEGFAKLKTHVVGKRNKINCIRHYGEHNLLDKLFSDAKNEKTFQRKTKKVSIYKKHLISAKKEFTKNVHDVLKIKVNQVKVAGHGANVENGPTTMIFLDPKNRSKVLGLFHTINDKEKDDLNLLLDQARVIIGVTNKIGKIRVQEFEKYVKNAYSHWIKAFKRFVHIKSSLHWTLGHIAQLIAGNDGYTMAGVSENSFEKWSKSYRYITVNNAKQTSMQDNNTDCLRAMYLQSRQDIRQLDKAKKPRESDDEISKLIDSFFLKSEDGKVWSFETERLNP